MSYPPTETASVESVYRPLPDGPSPRWGRAAQGLRVMRLAIWTSLGIRVGGAAFAQAAFHVRNPPASLDQMGSLFVVGGLLANLALSVGLWRFSGLPRSTGASRPAVAALVCFVTALTVAMVAEHLMRPLSRLGTSMVVISLLFVVRGLVSLVLQAAYLAMLVRALTVAIRSVGEALPRWSRWVVPAFVTWKVLTIPAHYVLLLSRHISVVNLPWLLTSLAAEAALAVALAALLRRAEGVLAGQEAPESA